MRVLVVAAHPDDEVLGCGGTIAALTDAGVPVRTCLLSGEASARHLRPDMAEFMSNIDEAHRILGVSEAPVMGGFPNIAFNTVPHLQMVQFIEGAIAEFGADVVFTHLAGDLNDDHMAVSRASMAACRLFQRRPGFPRLKGLYMYEVPSSTDWAFPSGGPVFQPTSFFPIGATLERKLDALRAYKGVMRDFPHPRSPEVLRGLAALRGGQSGMTYAEAFQVAFQSLDAEMLLR